MGRHVRAGTLEVWVEQVGRGSDVLLIGGAGEPWSRGSPNSTGWPTATG